MVLQVFLCYPTGMGLFGNRHAPCEAIFATLRAEISELRARVAAAESTVAETATTAYKHMKKGEQAARRALEASESANQGRSETEGAAGTPLAPTLTGARARIAARRLARMTKVEANGVHP